MSQHPSTQAGPSNPAASANACRPPAGTADGARGGHDTVPCSHAAPTQPRQRELPRNWLIVIGSQLLVGTAMALAHTGLLSHDLALYLVLVATVASVATVTEL